MNPHVKVYMQYFDFVSQSEVMCEACGCPAVDIHHINGRGKEKDIISNLVALCRKHHTMCHDEKVPKDEIQLIHNYFLSGSRKKFLS